MRYFKDSDLHIDQSHLNATQARDQLYPDLAVAEIMLFEVTHHHYSEWSSNKHSMLWLPNKQDYGAAAKQCAQAILGKDHYIDNFERASEFAIFLDPPLSRSAAVELGFEEQVWVSNQDPQPPIRYVYDAHGVRMRFEGKRPTVREFIEHILAVGEKNGRNQMRAELTGLLRHEH